MTGGLTTAGLLEAAARAGEAVTTHQLKRWRREGLLPRPEQIHRKGQRGSESVYPPGTLTQLLGVARLHRRERRFDQLRFDAWWEGCWVNEPQLRASAASLLDDPLGEIRQVLRRHPDPFEAAEILLRAGKPSDSRSPVTRLLRARVRSRDEDLITAMHALLEFALGGDPVWDSIDVGLDDPEPSPHQLLRQAMGLHRAETDELDGVPLINSPADLLGDLRALRDAGAFELQRPGTALLSAERGRLEAARHAARLFADQLPVLVTALEHRHRRDAGGTGLFRAMAQRDERWLRVFLLRFFVVAPLANAVSLAELETAVEDALPAARATVEIAEAFPGYKKYLQPGGEADLLELPAEEREAIHSNLRDFVSQRPQLSVALGDPKT